MSTIEREPLPWIKLRAGVFAEGSFQAALRDADTARSWLQILSWTATRGAVEVERDRLGMMLGAGEVVIAQLELHGVVVAIGDGRVRVAHAWALAAREEALCHREAQAAKGLASGRARASKAGERTTVQPRSNRGSTTRPDKTGPDQTENQPAAEPRPCAPSRAPSARPAVNAGGTALTRAWSEAWRRTRPSEWAWARKDAVALSKALELAGGDEAEVLRRIERLLESSDPFHARAASPGLLLSQWNQLGHEVRKLSHAERQLLEIERQLREPGPSPFEVQS